MLFFPHDRTEKGSFFCALLVFAVLCSQLALAQPQAPIEWADTHLLLSGPTGLEATCEATEIAAHGDTIIVTLLRNAGAIGILTQVSITGDNGETWSPWYVLADTTINNHGGGVVTAAFVSDAILVCGEWEPERNGFHRTTDLGWTWTLQDSTLWLMRLFDQSGDTLFCMSQGHYVTWTMDGGQTFAPLRQFDLGIWYYSITSLAVSGNWLHVVARGQESQWERMHTYYARAPLLEGPFQDMQILNSDFYWATLAHLEFAEDGTGVMLAPYDLDSPAPLASTVMLNVTRDDGVTWSQADTISAVQAAGFQTEGIVRSDRLWLAYWSDSVTFAGFSEPGAKACISANRGRSWYPTQQVEDADWRFGAIYEADLRPDRAAIYVSCHEFEDVV
jgi:hypothetical protein